MQAGQCIDPPEPWWAGPTERAGDWDRTGTTLHISFCRIRPAPQPQSCGVANRHESACLQDDEPDIPGRRLPIARQTRIRSHTGVQSLRGPMPHPTPDPPLTTGFCTCTSGAERPGEGVCPAKSTLGRLGYPGCREKAGASRFSWQVAPPKWTHGRFGWSVAPANSNDGELPWSVGDRNAGREAPGTPCALEIGWEERSRGPWSACQSLDEPGATLLLGSLHGLRRLGPTQSASMIALNVGLGRNEALALASSGR